MPKRYHIRAKWDGDAGVWVSSSNIPGLSIEAETIAEFRELAAILAPEMMADNLEPDEQGPFEIEVATVDLASREGVVQNIVAPDGLRRVCILKRPDGLFQFREDRVVEYDDTEPYWTEGYPFSGLYSTLGAADASARSSISWLDPSA